MKIDLEWIEATESIAANSSGTALAFAPTGKVVVAGGGGGDPALTLWESKPGADGSVWIAGATNPTGSAINLKAWALCASTDDVDYL